MFKTYNEIAAKDGAYHEIKKLDSIQGLFYIWVKFEQFVYRQWSYTSKKAGDFQITHRKLMTKHSIKRYRIKEIEKVITGIRRTRNSLHTDGIYHNEDGKSYSFELLGTSYILEDKKSVTPLSILSIIRFLLDHYYELNS